MLGPAFQANADPDPDPGFWAQKLKKFTAEKNNFLKIYLS